MVPASPQMPIAELRRLMARTHSNGLYEGKSLPFGIEPIDAVLPSGGLALGAVHEICEQGSDGARASLSALFVAGILARVGLHPDRVIYCETWKDAEVLPAMEEGLRHGGLAGVVGELVRLPLTPSRRLQLAAESSGVIALALRRSGPAADQHNASFLALARKRGTKRPND